MNEQKIEPRLEEEISRAAAAESRIPVIIEFAQRVDAPLSEDREAGLERLERQIEAAQRPLVGRLRELGVADVRRSALANALSASLTPAQIAAASDHPDVRLIRLRREEQVTT